MSKMKTKMLFYFYLLCDIIMAACVVTYVAWTGVMSPWVLYRSRPQLLCHHVSRNARHQAYTLIQQCHTFSVYHWELKVQFSQEQVMFCYMKYCNACCLFCLLLLSRLGTFYWLHISDVEGEMYQRIFLILAFAYTRYS